MSTGEPLVLRDVRFYKSTQSRAGATIEGRPEIAFAGRSNAGKSSLINYLCNRKKLAYVGKTPGKTRLVNYFLVNDSFYLVDLPGYGYANVSKEELSAWSTMVETFFNESSEELHGLVVCLDIRREPSSQDIQMLEWALYYSVPCAIAATKADKVAKSKRPAAAAKISRVIKETIEDAPLMPVIPVSAAERFGAEQLLQQIRSMLEADSPT